MPVGSTPAAAHANDGRAFAPRGSGENAPSMTRREAPRSTQVDGSAFAVSRTDLWSRAAAPSERKRLAGRPASDPPSRDSAPPTIIAAWVEKASNVSDTLPKMRPASLTLWTASARLAFTSDTTSRALSARRRPRREDRARAPIPRRAPRGSPASRSGTSGPSRRFNLNVPYFSGRARARPYRSFRWRSRRCRSRSQL